MCFLGLFVADLDGFADADGDDHRDVVFVTSIFVAVRVNEISLFKLYSQENVSRSGHREDEMGDRHRGCEPECEQPAEIEWVTHVTIEHRRPEFQLFVLSADQEQKYLSQSKEIEVIDQERACQDQQPTHRE